MTEDITSLPEGGYNSALVNEIFTRYSEHHPIAGSDSFSRFPVAVSQQYLHKIARLGQILNLALEMVVTSYFSDERIRAVYRFDKEMEDILKIASDMPYKVGLCRPDLVFDVNGQARICEIGARYPFNGSMISYYLNRALSYPGAMDSDEYDTVGNISYLVDDLLGHFDHSQPLVMLHKNEKGTEIFNIFREFRKKGLETLKATPSDLRADNGFLTLNGLPVSQIILEMDREELRNFSPEELNLIIRKCNCLNDVRTLILVHDKRILAVLYDQGIMHDYLSVDDYNYLRSFLIPTFSLVSAERRKEIIASPLNWILKQNSGGRGIGIYLSENYTPDEWAKIISDNWQDYMAQEYVIQRQFSFPVNNTAQAINLVGVFFGFNGHTYGPGAFRGSSESIVNVHEGRGLNYPVLVSRL